MITAIITGAGTSTRFGKNKMLSEIDGVPVLAHTLQRFIDSGVIDEYIVTARKRDIPAYIEIIDDLGINGTVVEGGPERIISLQNGIKASSGDIIITHDGARPLTPTTLIIEVVEAVKKFGAVMTAVNPTATVKTTGEGMRIRSTLLRERTWIAQTPQGFERNIIESAIDAAVSKNYFVPTDDSEIVTEMTDHQVYIVPGDHVNLKITHPADLTIANQLYKEEKG